MTIRNRSRSDPDVTGSYSRTYYVNGIPTSTIHYDYTKLSKNESMTDHVYAGFSDAIKNGSIVNQDCSYSTSTKLFSGYGEFDISVGSSYYRFHGACMKFFFIGMAVSPVRRVYHLDDAKFDALANVDPSPAEMLEDVLEMRETFRFLEEYTPKLLAESKDLYRAAKRAARLRGIPFARAASGAWLTYRFAFSPLIRSIMTLLEELHTRRRYPVHQTARGKKTASYEDVVESITNVLEYRRVQKTQFDTRASIRYRVHNTANDWRYKYGLRAKDIPVGLWQVVPLSFLVDRVINISDSVKGLTALADPNVEFLAASTVERETVINTAIGLGFTNPAWSLTSSDTFSHTRFSYVRTVWFPSWTDTIPSIDLSGLVDSVTKFTDVLALSVSYLTGKPRR